MPGYGDGTYVRRPVFEPLPELETIASAVSRYDITRTGDANLSFDSLQLEIIPKMILIKEEDQEDDEGVLPDTSDWFSKL